MTITYRIWTFDDLQTVIRHTDQAAAKEQARLLSSERGALWMYGGYSGVGEDDISNYAQLEAYFKGERIWSAVLNGDAKAHNASPPVHELAGEINRRIEK